MANSLSILHAKSAAKQTHQSQLFHPCFFTKILWSGFAYCNLDSNVDPKNPQSIFCKVHDQRLAPNSLKDLCIKSSFVSSLSTNWIIVLILMQLLCHKGHYCSLLQGTLIKIVFGVIMVLYVIVVIFMIILLIDKCTNIVMNEEWEKKLNSFIRQNSTYTCCWLFFGLCLLVTPGVLESLLNAMPCKSLLDAMILQHGAQIILV